MNKRLKYLMSLELTVAISTGVFALSTPKATLALTQLDILYKRAYDDTINALNQKTQNSINEARTSISKLPSSLNSAIGEESPYLINIKMI